MLTCKWDDPYEYSVNSFWNYLNPEKHKIYGENSSWIWESRLCELIAQANTYMQMGWEKILRKVYIQNDGIPGVTLYKIKCHL